MNNNTQMQKELQSIEQLVEKNFSSSSPQRPVVSIESPVSALKAPLQPMISLQPPEIQRLFAVYKSASSAPDAQQQTITQALEACYMNDFDHDAASAKVLAAATYSAFAPDSVFSQNVYDDTDPSLTADADADDTQSQPQQPTTTKQKKQFPEARISLYAYEYFQETLSQSPQIFDQEPLLKNLFLSLLVCYYTNYHPSSWVRFEDKLTFHLASLSRRSQKFQNSATVTFHQSLGLNMRVVGSKHPILCYNFSWQQDEPPIDTPDNPIISLGPLLPKTIQSAVKKAQI